MTTSWSENSLAGAILRLTITIFCGVCLLNLTVLGLVTAIPVKSWLFYNPDKHLHTANTFLNRRFLDIHNTSTGTHSDRFENKILTNLFKSHQQESHQQDNQQHDKKNDLHFYSPDEIVQCLDLLFVERKKSIRLAFVGDSLMRNQFLSFITVRLEMTTLSDQFGQLVLNLLNHI